MRILITNDDGINAPGLAVLEAIARELTDDVWVVAPETDQSGASHSLTLHVPLRLRKINPKRFAVSGTPTDCVLLATRNIMTDATPDLVLSGVNRGANMGEDVHYSGTIAAAKEATLLGVPAIAFSQVFLPDQGLKWETARRHGPGLVRRVLESEWPHGMLLNVNFPPLDPDDVKGIKVARQGKRKIGDKIVHGRDPRGVPYYWIGGLRREGMDNKGTDLHAVAQGFIAMTPLHIDLTHDASLERLKRALET